jgi:hypothetical protein
MEIGNMTMVFKGLLYQSQQLFVSGGAAVGIPTARATRVRVTDFLGDFNDNDIEIQRLRDFTIFNETWALSPFAAFLALPTPRFFVQGFTQIDIPLNKSRITYTEAAVHNTEPTELVFTPISVTDSIREQTLLQLDLGTGYWLVRRPAGPNVWITGFAPQVEFHYTTTLDNADIRTLPLAPRSSTLSVVGPNNTLLTEPNPTVGNLRNRLDIFNITVGNTLEFAQRATLATGFTFPFNGADNRTFVWEFQLQFNYYFGGPRPQPPQFQ